MISEIKTVLFSVEEVSEVKVIPHLFIQIVLEPNSTREIRKKVHDLEFELIQKFGGKIKFDFTVISSNGYINKNGG